MYKDHRIHYRERSLYWLHKSICVANGNKLAEYYLGRIYRLNCTYTKQSIDSYIVNITKGIYWYNKSITHGDENAQADLISFLDQRIALNKECFDRINDLLDLSYDNPQTVRDLIDMDREYRFLVYNVLYNHLKSIPEDILKLIKDY
jgi:hypothetical protein